jgi:hypothetical protein
VTPEEVLVALTPERLRALVLGVARQLPGGCTVGAPVELLVARVLECCTLDGPQTYLRTRGILREAVEATPGMRYVASPG